MKKAVKGFPSVSFSYSIVPFSAYRLPPKRNRMKKNDMHKNVSRTDPKNK